MSAESEQPRTDPQIAALEAHVSRQQEAISHLEAELRQMRRSITWRGTEPIRRAYAYLEGWRRNIGGRRSRSASAEAMIRHDEPGIHEQVSSALASDDNAYWTPDHFEAVKALESTEVTNIVVCMGRQTTIGLRCLEAVRANTSPGAYRLYIVVHAQDAARLPGDTIADAEVIIHEMQQFNFARANNLALARCTGDVVLLNDDTEVTPGWLERLRADARGFALTSARTEDGRSGNPDTWGQGPCRLTRHPITMFCAFIPLRVRAVVGLLDEEFAYYGGEDVDYSIRTLSHGFPLVVSSGFVRHAGARSFGWYKDPLMQESARVITDRYDLRPPYDLSSVKPLVSVVVPVRNDATALTTTVSALLVGDYPHIEVIAVDDASSDETDEAIRALQATDGRVIGVRLAQSVGPIRVQARGIAASRGQFVALAQAGEAPMPNRVAAPLEHIMAHPALDVVYCGFDMVTASGTHPWRMRPFDLESYREHLFDIQAGTLLARRQVWVDVPFAAHFEQAAEYDWAFRVIRRGYRIGYCPARVMKSAGGGAIGEEQVAEISERERLVNGLTRK